MPVIVGCGDDGDAVKAAELWGQSQSSGMGGGGSSPPWQAGSKQMEMWPGFEQHQHRPTGR